MMITDLLSRENIDKILKGSFKEKEYEILSCEKGIIDSAIIGFLSAQEKVSIVYKSEGKVKKLYLFVKGLPSIPYRREAILSSGAFKKEVMIYQLFLKSFKENASGDPVPEYFLGKPDEVVVLEDISLKGFQNVPLLKTLDLEHCLRVVEVLAKLHAESLIFEISNNCKLNQHIPLLNEETSFLNDENNRTRRNIIVSAEACKFMANKYITNYSAHVFDKSFKYLNGLIDLMKPSKKYPNVLSHNDLWVNNIMFRYNDKGDVTDACLVDFQLAAYRPISFDLQLFLYLCTDKELRDNHYKSLCRNYYQHLSEIMSLKGIELNGILSWDNFLNVCNETLPTVLTIAPIWLQFVLIPEKIIREALEDDKKWQIFYEKNRNDYILRAAEECSEYKERFVQSLIDLFEYIKSFDNFEDNKVC